MGIPTTVQFNEPQVTLGCGDQWIISLDQLGRVYCTVNDGTGPYRSQGNDANRETSYMLSQGWTLYNHQHFRLDNFDVSDLANPTWDVTPAFNYNNAPPGGEPFYNYGLLINGTDKALSCIALSDCGAGQKHGSLSYVDPLPPDMPHTKFGSNAMCAWQDGQVWFGDDVELPNRDWSQAMPLDATLLTPHNRSINPAHPNEYKSGAWTHMGLVQMGPGYTFNKNFTDGRTRGFIFATAPAACINALANPGDARAQETLLATMWLGDNWESDPVYKARRAIRVPYDWRVYAGGDPALESNWPYDMDYAGAQPIMTWPEPASEWGQAWYPSTIQIEEQGIFLAIASSLELPDYPARSSRVVVKAATLVTGPWETVWDSDQDNGGDLYLQGNPGDRVFSPQFGPYYVQPDGTIKVTVCFSGVGDFQGVGWTTEVKRRYGMNWAEFILSFGSTTPQPTPGAVKSVAYDEADGTYGEGDQNPWGPLPGSLNFDHLNTVNDGQTVSQSYGPNSDRGFVVSPKYNHRIQRVTDLDLSNIAVPDWNWIECGDSNPVPGRRQQVGLSDGNFGKLYSFSTVVLTAAQWAVQLASTDYPGANMLARGPNFWGGGGWRMSIDGGATWRGRTNLNWNSINWADYGDNKVPTSWLTWVDDSNANSTTWGCGEDSAMCLMTVAQSPWIDNTRGQDLFDPDGSLGIRDYVFGYSQQALGNDTSGTAGGVAGNPNFMGNINTLCWRVNVGPPTARNIMALYNPANYEFLIGYNGLLPIWGSFANAIPMQTDTAFPTGWCNFGQGWYPAVVMVPSQALCFMMAIGKDRPAEGGEPFPQSSVIMRSAPSPWGPWTQISRRDKFTLQSPTVGKPFSPQFIANKCDRSSVLSNGDVELRLAYSMSGLAANFGMPSARTYGINVGDAVVTLDGGSTTPPPSGYPTVGGFNNPTVESQVTTISTQVPASAPVGALVTLTLTWGGDSTTTLDQPGVSPHNWIMSDKSVQATVIPTSCALYWKVITQADKDNPAINIALGGTFNATLSAEWHQNFDTQTPIGAIAKSNGSAINPISSGLVRQTAGGSRVVRLMAIGTILIDDSDYPNGTVPVYVRSVTGGSLYHTGGVCHEYVESGAAQAKAWPTNLTDGRYYAEMVFEVRPGSQTPSIVIANDDVNYAINGGSVTTSVLLNDIGSGLSIKPGSVGSPAFGTVQIIGDDIRYNHIQGQGVGQTDQIAYTAIDGQGIEDSATLIINIQDAPEPPAEGQSAVDRTEPKSGINTLAAKAALNAQLAAFAQESNTGFLHSPPGAGSQPATGEELAERGNRSILDYGNGGGTFADFLQAARDTKTLVLPPGDYVWEADYIYNDSNDRPFNDLTVIAFGATIRFTSGWRPDYWSDVTFYGAAFTSDPDVVHPIDPLHAKRWHFIFCHFFDMPWNAVRMTGGQMVDRPEFMSFYGCTSDNIGYSVDPTPDDPNGAIASQDSQSRGSTIYHNHGARGLVVDSCEFVRNGGHALHFYADGSTEIDAVAVVDSGLHDGLFRGIMTGGGASPPSRILFANLHITDCGARQPGPAELGFAGCAVGCNGILTQQTAGHYCRNYIDLVVENVAENPIEGSAHIFGCLLDLSGSRWDELGYGSRTEANSLRKFLSAADGIWIDGGALIATIVRNAGRDGILSATGTRDDLGLEYGVAVVDQLIAHNRIEGHNHNRRVYNDTRKAYHAIATTSLGGGSTNIERMTWVGNTAHAGSNQGPDDRLALLATSGDTLSGVAQYNTGFGGLLSLQIYGSGVSYENKVF